MASTAPRGTHDPEGPRRPYRTVWTGVSTGPKQGADKVQDGPLSIERRESADLELPCRRLRVVIVEDEAIIAMELEMLLEELDVDVVGAAMRADEAEALVAAHRPDFVTMDISLKGDVDGVTAACTLFQRYGVRSIFVSAYVDAKEMARAEAGDPLGWVKKPIEKGDLEEVLFRANLHDV